MNDWFSDLPSWIPGWIPWILILIVSLAWILDKFVFKTYSIFNLKTKNKKDAIDLVKEERDIFENKVQELENELNDLKIIERESGNALDKRIEHKKKDDTSDKIEEKEELIEETEGANIFSKMLEAFDENDYEKGLELLEAEAAKSKDENSRLDFLAFGLSLAFEKGNKQAFEDLKDLSVDNPNDPNITTWLANAYSFINEHSTALDLLENVLKETENESSKVSLVKSISDIYLQQEKVEEAICKLKESISSIREPVLMAKIYQKLGDIFETQQNYKKAFLFFERALVHNPTDTDLRFNIAYLYSNNSAPKFALYHYRKLLKIKKHKMASNNAGVACGKLSLPISSTNYYKEAEEQDNTLASANLAYKLLDVGFVDEAESILNNAEAKEEIHENVYRAHANISERESKENESLEKIDKDVDKLRKWRHKFGKAILDKSPNPNTISGTYDGEPSKLELDVKKSGEVVGKIYLKNREQSAELTGNLEGAGIRFEWKEPPKKKEEDKKDNLTGLSLPSVLSTPVRPPRSEKGILIYEDGNLQGYSSSGEESLDPTMSIYWTNWNLDKIE
ncbi:MAG: tetratricopeptide repeat protein [Candidatus Paceibacterota bacterium]